MNIDQLANWGRAVRKARRARNLTQQDLADLVGVSRNMVGLWERGLHEPHAENLARVQEVLGLGEVETTPADADADAFLPVVRSLLNLVPKQRRPEAMVEITKVLARAAGLPNAP